jgi:hypothetical protein
MKLKDTAIAWTPGVGVEVEPISSPGGSKTFDRHPLQTGGFRYDLGRAEGERAQHAVLAIFHMLVVRDGLPPMTVHNAFMDIEEYRDSICIDCLPAAVPRWARQCEWRGPPVGYISTSPRWRPRSAFPGASWRAAYLRGPRRFTWIAVYKLAVGARRGRQRRAALERLTARALSL